MELIHEIFYSGVCVEIFLCEQAQVVFNPDQEEDVQLPAGVIPPVYVTTTLCYLTSPQFVVQYATLSDNRVVYDFGNLGGENSAGQPVNANSCASNRYKYKVELINVGFIADPVLVGGTFRLKVTLDDDDENSTLSRRTYSFPAPLNLTGSPVSAVLGSPFTWTCHVTSDYPVIEWYRDSTNLGQIGILNGACETFGQNDSYIYNCQQSALTYTLTIPGSSLTEELQGSTWRCRDATTVVKGSEFRKLDIVVPVTSVTMSPGGNGSNFNAHEDDVVTFTCTTNNANPPPTILWYIGSSDVTSMAGSNRTTLTLNVSREYHQVTVRCEAKNTGNTENLNDSSIFHVIFPPANNEELQLTGYIIGQVLYENNPPMIEISCSQPGGNPVVNMTFKCGSLTGTNENKDTEAIRRFSLTNNRSLDGTRCVCTSTHINGYMRNKSVTFTVYYPPSTPTISISFPFPWKANDSQSLTCNTTRGNPVTTTYIWKKGEPVLSTTSQTYSINPLEPIDNGRQLSCQVNNDFTLHQNVTLTSDVTKLQVEYDPHVTLGQSSVEVIEGHSAVLRCSATGNPVPTVTWYRDTTPVTESTISSSKYNVTNANRTLTGYYTCEANSSSTGSNILQPDQKNTHLRVFYPPTVQIHFQNTTENTGNHTIRCSAEGDPNNSTFVALHQMIESTLIRNITSFTQFSPGNMTLNINMVSYQDMGTYTCLASNGIPDRSNHMVQSDSSYFNVITSAKFEMDQYTVRSDIDTEAVVKIPFYRNPPATESDVVWTSNTATSNGTVMSSANVSLSLNDTDVQQKLYGVDITLRGQSAIMNITSFQNYYEGNYTLKIRSNHADSAEVTVTLIRSGPPDTPSYFQLLSIKVTSVVLTWNKGSDGGHQQTFVVLYREKTAELYDVKQIIDTTVNVTITDEIKHLKSDTSYEFILYSFNEKGNSTGYKTLGERTLKAQVTFNPDPDEDIQLQTPVLTPPVEVTTIECYQSSPTFRVQYVTLEANEAVYTIPLDLGIYELPGNPIDDSACGHSGKLKYRVTLSNLAFIADSSLVGGTFKLKVTLVNIEGNSTFSKRTYTFPAPFNMTGSSLSAVLSSEFTWTCHVTSDYPIIEWVTSLSKTLVQSGTLQNGTCVIFNQNDSYTYQCHKLNLTYTLTIPGPSLTEELQGSTWRCREVNNETKGSRFMKLDIIVPVTTVTISPGSGSTLNADENQNLTFTCTTNEVNPPPTILWYIGSSDVTSQATGSNRTTLTLNATRVYHEVSIRCMAWNTGNTANQSDSTTLNVRYSPRNDQELQIIGYISGQVLYENTPAMISIYCTQPGGNPVANMTFTCGPKTGTNKNNATDAIRNITLTNNRSLDGKHCVCTSTHINDFMRSTSVNFTVYYPPSNPTINTSSLFPWKAKQNKSLICNTTPGNPAVISYIWKEGESKLPIVSKTFEFNHLQPNDDGRHLSCQINNNFTLHKNVILKSNVTTLKVEYDPIITLEQSSVEVIEGQTTEIKCSATGNPVPNLAWYRGSTPVTGSTVSASAYNITSIFMIVNINRTSTGNFTCLATSSSTGSNVLLPDEKAVFLRVFYPPTVILSLRNATENTYNHDIRCSAVGDPNNATYRPLEQKIGSTSIRNITSFTESSPGNITLTISTVSYQDMGTYTCLASNGIPDRNNQKIQLNRGYFNVITSAKFEKDQYTVRSDIDTEAVVRIPFYRNPPANESDVVWTRYTGTSNETLDTSANVSLSLNDADVQQTLHGVDVTLRGQSATMDITSFQSFYEGNYTLKIRSSHTDSAEVQIALIRSGPPDTPSDFQLLNRKVTSFVLTWNKGSDGGHPQTFVILYREKTSEIYTMKQLEDTTMNRNITYEIKSLQPGTSYEFLLYSFNEKGNSTGYRPLEERTLKAPEESSLTSLNSGLVGGAAGGGAAVLVVVIVIIVVMRRRHNHGKGNDSKGILNSKEMSAGTLRQDDYDDGEDGLKDNPLYGSGASGTSGTSGTNAVQGAGAAPENPSLYAEVVKPKKKYPAKVSEDPPPIYAEVDKSNKKGKGPLKPKKKSPAKGGEDPPPIYAEVNKPNKKGDKGKQKQQKAKGKIEGDVYENVDGFKEKETQFNDPAEKQETKGNEPRGYRNQDGLLYVDVKFDQPPPTGKPVIRGEERTGYAMIEFEEPPTSSTADDVKGAEGGI